MWDSIEKKVHAGERISEEEAVWLYRTPDIYRLGRLASHVREKKNGRKATYVRNMHLNYSNVCIYDCHFCSFYRKEGASGSWEMDLDSVFQYAAKSQFHQLSEVHIVGGVHPKLPYEFYLEMLRGLKERYPKLHLKGFTATEIDHLSRISGKSLEDLFTELREAGLDSLPGGGAEIFAKRVWDQICSRKAKPDRWLEIHKAWHQMGGKSTCTMLYGHIETVEERVDHMRRLRDLQDETGGFAAFIPLCFQVENNRLSHIPKVSANTDLRVHAVARLYLDNFDHIKAYWIMTGLKMAQVLLSFGVDDIDGTVLEERVVHMAGADSPLGVTENELRALIEEAGFEPVLRDTLYHSLEPSSQI
jgi:aminodeoxyfutalosine synthase